MNDTNALDQIARQLGDLNSTLSLIADRLGGKPGDRCTDPDRSSHHCCGMPDSEEIDDWVTFVRQNPYSGDVTPEVMANLMPYVAVPAGNVVVLQRQHEAGFYVKLHDTWGVGLGEGKIAVTVFDPDDPEVEMTRLLDDANAAAAVFLDDTYLDAMWQAAVSGAASRMAFRRLT